MNIEARKALLKASLTPRSKPLIQKRYSGIGWWLSGRWRDPGMLGESYMKMLWFTFLYVPVAPLSVYLLEREGRVETVLGRLSLRNFRDIYPGRHMRLYFSSFFDGIIFVAIVAALIAVIYLIRWLYGPIKFQ